MSADHIDYLLKKLELKKPVSCAQDICKGVLTYAELADLFAETDESVLVGNKKIVGDVFKNI